MPDARLVIAGRAWTRATRQRIAPLAAADARVRLDLGFVPDEELQVYLRAADVVAAPFLEIFTSGSVLLAMSFERAVIAPRRGCVAETLDDAGGLLYDADDPRGLERALRAAMTADLEAMGRHNGERARSLRVAPHRRRHPRRLRGRRCRAERARPPDARPIVGAAHRPSWPGAGSAWCQRRAARPAGRDPRPGRYEEAAPVDLRGRLMALEAGMPRT